MTCIIFWDVQRGSSTYVNTPNGTSIVHDLGKGSYKTGNKKFSPLIHLKNNGVEKLDCAIITHPHKDHICDIMSLDELPPRVLTWPDRITRADLMKEVKNQDRSLFEKYLELSQIYSESVAPEQNPRFAPNNGGVNIQIFTPTSCTRSDFNNHSVVTVISYGHTKVLLPGDNEIPSWRELLGRADFKDSIRDVDVLLAPHHGRDSGFCRELFQYFNPKLT